VVLFDLLALCTQHSGALDACLGPLFGSGCVRKLGFEVAGDISKLAGSWPQVAAFRHVCAVTDLRPLWVAYGVAAKLQVGGSGLSGGARCGGRAGALDGQLQAVRAACVG
jgi:hypothetical protein